MPEVVEIHLTRGAVAVIDAADLPRVANRKWRTTKDGYAVADIDGKVTFMHRWLLKLSKGDGLSVDHIDRNKLNNRRDNLRACTHSQNMQNQSGQPRRSLSGVKGVYWVAKDYTWVAEVCANKKKYRSYHRTKEAAIEARNKLAKELHGEFYRESK